MSSSAAATRPVSTRHTVFTAPPFGVGVGEPCAQREDGDFVGVDTGTVYPAATHYARPRLLARVRRVKADDTTGMMHLADPERAAKRAQFAGCLITVEVAHHYGEHLVYYAADVRDYFSADEVEILPDGWACVAP